MEQKASALAAKDTMNWYQIIPCGPGSTVGFCVEFRQEYFNFIPGSLNGTGMLH